VESSGEGEIRRILVAVDGSPQSIRAVRMALNIAKAVGASIDFISVSELSDIPTLMAEAQNEQSEEYARLALGMSMKLALAKGVKAEVVLRKGHPAGQIVRYADEIKPDLIVLGSRGLSGARGAILGSVSTAVSRSTGYAVLIVK
jgi:nucleotide-binding universal stress UspA family protein